MVTGDSGKAAEAAFIGDKANGGPPARIGVPAAGVRSGSVGVHL